jgi:ABC-type bacteriocin/lantibiotic exporter with double-glycine peptidase domain
LIDDVLVHGDYNGLNLLGAAMLCIPLINSTLKIGASRSIIRASGALGELTMPFVESHPVGNAWFSNKVGTGITSNLRKYLFSHLQKMSLRFYTNTKTGELMSRFVERQHVSLHHVRLTN